LKLPNRLLKWIFFVLLVRPIIWIVIGLNVRNRELLPSKGPAIIVANHNSHLDTMVLVSLLSSKLLPIIKPVAAADYFLRNALLAWFSTQIIGILPVARGQRKAKPLAEVFASLEEGNILILFPEGSRGEPEVRQSLKRGISHIAKQFQDVPIIPVYLHGLGKALPKGEIVLVPFFCDVFVGEPIYGRDQSDELTQVLSRSFEQLSSGILS
jgi:1-acyl-sn-glycerol-3-phosphate acyltransferase